MGDGPGSPLIKRSDERIDDCWNCWGRLRGRTEPENLEMQVLRGSEEHPQTNNAATDGQEPLTGPEEPPPINPPPPPSNADFEQFLASIENCELEEVRKYFSDTDDDGRKQLLEMKSKESDRHDFPGGLTAFHCVAFVAERSSKSCLEMAETNQEKREREEALRKIIKILLDEKGNINAKDDRGYAPLHYAVIKNSEFTTKLLLESEKCDGNLLDDQERTPLMLAFVYNAEKVVKELIGVLQPDILKKTDADTILHFLLKCGRTMINAFLDALDSDAWKESLRKMLNEKNYLGITPLQICVEAGHVQELERLLDLLTSAVPIALSEEPVDLQEQEYLKGVRTYTIQQNSHILYVAATIGNSKIFKVLCEFGFPIKDEKGEMVKNKDEENLLHVAAKNNHREIIKQLVESGDKVTMRALLEVTDNNGMTPLLHTASTNAWEAADYMIDFLLDGNELDLFFRMNKKRENMLMLASNNSHADFIKNFMEKLTNDSWINERYRRSIDSSRNTPIHHAAECGSLDSIKILLKHGAILTALDVSNDTVLHVAARAGHVSVVEYLLSCSKEHLEKQQREQQQKQNQQQIDVEQDIYVILNARNSISNIPLHEAAAAGFAEICQMLLQKGADPKAKNRMDMTPFDVAISKGQAECVKVLLKHSDIDGDAGETILAPLHYAAREGHSRIVAYLLANKAQIDKCLFDPNENVRKTALDIALDHKKEEVAKTLLSSHDWESLLRRRKEYDLNEKDAPLVTPMRRMIEEFPALAKQVMDLCIQLKDQKDVIYYNFEFIDDTFVMPMKQNGEDCWGLGNKEEEIPYDEVGNVKDDAKPYSENQIQIYKKHPLMLMIEAENEDSKKLLDHDLVKTMLKRRWKTFGRFGYFWLSFAPYAVFLLFFTLMIINIDRKIIKTKEGSRAIGIEDVHANVTFRDSKESLTEVANNIDWVDWVRIVGVSFFLFFLLFKEGYQFKQLGRKAYISWENRGNLGELLVYFLSAFTIGWRILNLTDWVEIFFGSKVDLSDGFWILASIVFAISWFNLLMLLSKWKYSGLFIVMFKKVGKSFVKLAATFILFIMAFSFSFLMLIHKKNEFSQWDYSFFKTFMMSTGEIDFSGIFFNEKDHFENRHGTKYFTMVIFFIFVVFIVILVHNLFTGVAVGNIEDIMKAAKLKELAIEAECLLMQATLSENIMRSQKYRHWVSVNRKERTVTSRIVLFWKLHWKAIGTYFGWNSSCCTSCFCCSVSNEDQAEAAQKPQPPTNRQPPTLEKWKKEVNKLKKSQEDNFFPEDPIKKLVNNEKKIISLQKEAKQKQQQAKEVNKLKKSQEDDFFPEDPIKKLVNNEKKIISLEKEVKELKTELASQKEQMTAQIQQMAVQNQEIAVQNEQMISKTEEKFDIIIYTLITQREPMTIKNQNLEEQLKQIMNKFQELPEPEDKTKESIPKSDKSDKPEKESENKKQEERMTYQSSGNPRAFLEQSPVSLPKQMPLQLGLPNLGNTCYMNAVVQVLAATKSLANFFRNFEYTETMQDQTLQQEPNAQLHGSNGAVAQAFATLLNKLYDNECSEEDMKNFRAVVGDCSPDYKTHNQQDAQEFLNLLLDKLHEDLNLRNDEDFSPDDALAERRLAHDSVITNLFKGQWRSSKVCRSCPLRKSQLEPYMSVPLPIPPHKSRNQGHLDQNSDRLAKDDAPEELTLQLCLKAFTSEETIECRCDRCQGQTAHHKQLTFDSCPQILILHLKRFRHIQNEITEPNKVERVTDPVKFPIEGLDMSPFISASNPKDDKNFNKEMQATVSHSSPDDNIYDLFAVINHIGDRVSSGHYTATVKNPTDGIWRTFDDLNVSENTNSTDQSENAYLMFYERRSSRVKRQSSKKASGGIRHPESEKESGKLEKESGKPEKESDAKAPPESEADSENNKQNPRAFLEQSPVSLPKQEESETTIVDDVDQSLLPPDVTF